jgi:hypothetical protein
MKIKPEPIIAMGPGSEVAGGWAVSDDFDVAPKVSRDKHRHIKRVMRAFIIGFLIDL